MTLTDHLTRLEFRLRARSMRLAAELRRVENGPRALRFAADPGAERKTRIRLGLATRASRRLHPSRLP